jgi:hypothetical protein
MLAVLTIQHEEITIAASLRKHFALLAAKFSVEQHRRLHGVPVVHVVR